MTKLFDRMSIDDVIRADADGMPVFRRCFDHERLLTFFDDSGAIAFDEWWQESGLERFSEWMEKGNNAPTTKNM